MTATELSLPAGAGLASQAHRLGWGRVAEGVTCTAPERPPGARRGPAGGGALRRITGVAADAPGVQGFLGHEEVLRGYDVVAVRPGSEEAFAYCCEKARHCDLISVDLCRRLPFRFRAQTVRRALERGLHFEISYAGALRSPALRKTLFSNARALAWATQGEGLVVSSGATAPLQLRAPPDVVNMATFFGLGDRAAKAAVTERCEAVLRAGARRRRLDGAVSGPPSFLEGGAARMDLG